MTDNMPDLWRPLTVSLYNTVVSFEARSLKRGVVCRLMPYLKADATLDDSLEIIDKIADVLPEYIRNINGLQLNGRNVTPEEMAGEGIFFEVLSLIAAELIKLSTFSAYQAKN